MKYRTILKKITTMALLDVDAKAAKAKSGNDVLLFVMKSILK